MEEKAKQEEEMKFLKEREEEQRRLMEEAKEKQRYGKDHWFKKKILNTFFEETIPGVEITAGHRATSHKYRNFVQKDFKDVRRIFWSVAHFERHCQKDNFDPCYPEIKSLKLIVDLM